MIKSCRAGENAPASFKAAEAARAFAFVCEKRAAPPLWKRVSYKVCGRERTAVAGPDIALKDGRPFGYETIFEASEGRMALGAILNWA